MRRFVIGMKKIIVLQLVVCAALLFTASVVQVRAATLSVPESLKAFIAAMERFNDSVDRSVPWGKIDENDVLPRDPISRLDVLFRPLFNLGVSKDTMESEKDSFRWKSVTYYEQGNEFRIVCEHIAGGGRDIYEGTYDPASDRLKCRRVWYEGKGKIVEDLEVEYMKTDFGYVTRFYDVERSVVHKLAIKGDEGIVSWGEAKFDTLYASMDFPKEGRMWYEISGDRLVLQPWDGPAREYAIKK
jgi:hypothetical protein